MLLSVPRYLGGRYSGFIFSSRTELTRALDAFRQSAEENRHIWEVVMSHPDPSLLRAIDIMNYAFLNRGAVVHTAREGDGGEHAARVDEDSCRCPRRWRDVRDCRAQNRAIRVRPGMNVQDLSPN